jgi:hypothetical protein
MLQQFFACEANVMRPTEDCTNDDNDKLPWTTPDNRKCIPAANADSVKEKGVQ